MSCTLYFSLFESLISLSASFEDQVSINFGCSTLKDSDNWFFSTFSFSLLNPFKLFSACFLNEYSKLTYRKGHLPFWLLLMGLQIANGDCKWEAVFNLHKRDPECHSMNSMNIREN